MNTPRRHAVLAAAALGVACPAAVQAQSFEQYLVPTVPGYDQDRGIDILARPRTEYDPLGVHVGAFTIRPQLDEAVTYNSNVLGTRPAVGSWIIGSSPQVAFNSNYSTNSIGGSFGLSNLAYLDQKQQTHTDANASLGGTYQIGQDLLTVAASEIYQHENPTDINSQGIVRPLGFEVSDVRLRYSTTFFRWTIEPNVEYIGYRFDDELLPGEVLRQKARDRDIYIGGVTIRFGDFRERSLVLVVHGIDSTYIANLGGAPRPNSLGVEVLFGVNYAVSGNLQFLALGGYEERTFAGNVYPSRASPVGEAAVVWTPSGLTTVTGRVSQSIEDTIGETTTGVAQTIGKIVIDHELLRNWLLQGRASLDYANYGKGFGQQRQDNIGAGITYVFNRNMRLTAAYDFTIQTGATTGQTTVITALNQFFSSQSIYRAHIATLSLRFTL